MLRLAPLLVALLFGGCAHNPFDVFNPAAPSILQGGPSATAPIDNPLRQNEMVAIEAAYRGAVAAWGTYRRVCAPPGSTLAQVPAACANRAQVLTAFRDAYRKARPAMATLREFARKPRISAYDAFQSARQVVANFVTIADQTGVQ